jgi:hypothetical protein
MWVFIHGDKIMATVRKEKTAKDIARKIVGQGYRVMYAHEILDPEDIWDLT